MATFVLVHGAWHGAWCWERVRPLLETAGHHVVAEDLPGMGEDRTPLACVTLAGWAQSVADLCSAAPEPVILVGHSRGGIVISQAAELVSDRIRRLVYLTAFLLPSGQSLDGALVGDPAPGDPLPVEPTPDGISLSIRRDEAGPIFYNETPPDLVARAASLLVPEPFQPLGAPLSLANPDAARIPRAYIACLRDRAIPIAMQRRMAAAMPCDIVIEMDTDHSPFYSAPEALARHLASLA